VTTSGFQPEKLVFIALIEQAQILNLLAAPTEDFRLRTCSPVFTAPIEYPKFQTCSLVFTPPVFMGITGFEPACWVFLALCSAR
jgi:hypothetical protein